MDRLRSLETMGEGLAQELLNPLNSIKAFVQLAPLRKSDEEFLTRFNSVVSQDVARIERLTKEIREYAQPVELKFGQGDVNDILLSCLSFIAVHPDYRRVSVEKVLDANLPPTLLSRQQIMQVFFNLILYVLKGNQSLGTGISVKTRGIMSSTKKLWIEIEIAEIGGNISPNTLEHVLNVPEPSKISLQDDEQTELGLEIAKQIIQGHHGRIRVSREVGRGTVFSVGLPVHEGCEGGI